VQQISFSLVRGSTQLPFFLVSRPPTNPYKSSSAANMGGCGLADASQHQTAYLRCVLRGPPFKCVLGGPSLRWRFKRHYVYVQSLISGAFQMLTCNTDDLPISKVTVFGAVDLTTAILAASKWCLPLDMQGSAY
jgi:hypothetical protein